ncbi:GtrA family protein [Actomonas aquatica]|uniref:GtrA family protein n=1 Tax=Actomonas aquatica TaxID=2866162 RepID=A0ABZ1CD07_9BACT|nr:GtrA family protein [Opitutus sp. WL0086]WRQ89466.1 GtrA family protein [Opitutus sp. WL0086]
MPATDPTATSATTSNRSWRGWWIFLAIGLVGYLVLTFGVFALHEWAQFDERLAYAIMITLVMIGNFIANRRIVFPAGRTGAPARQAVKFLIAALTFRVIEFILYSLCIGPLGINYLVAIAVTSAVAYWAKYYVFSFWVFR